MDWILSRKIDEIQWFYIAIVVLLVVLVWALAWRRRHRDADAIYNLMYWFDDYGLGAVYQLLVLLSALALAWIGWRLPAEFEAMVAGNPSPYSPFATTATAVGRFAQLVGATGFFMIAMRSMRYVVPVMALMLVFLLIYLGYEYVTAI